MAIELNNHSDYSGSIGVSPRISFSHDLCQTDVVPVEQHNLSSLTSSSSIDFNFHIRQSSNQEYSSSSADELFSDGKILPVEIKKNISIEQPPPPLPPPPPPHTPDDKELKVISDEKQSSKSFWGFKRSSSLNCGSGYGRSLCPLPPLLSRSNSAGSSSNVKRSSQKHSSAASVNKGSQSSSSSSSSASYQKPPMKKNITYGAYGNATGHINPVLNVPSANFFGLGSIFCNTKDKNKKK